MKRIFLLFSLACLSLSIYAREVVLSEKPISIQMAIGKEYIIRFPTVVTHTNLLNESAANSVATLLSPEGILYVTATEPFSKSRMVAELVDGRLVMLDLTGASMGPYDDSSILIKEKPKQPEPKQQPKIEPPKPEKNPYKPSFLENGGVMTLTPPSQISSRGSYHRQVQTAFQRYFGTINPTLGGIKQKVSNRSLDGLLRLNNGKLSFKVLDSRKVGDDYITVLLVNNLSQMVVEFDPRAIRGRWVFAATLHPVLTPSGTQHDQTLWALISQVPFDKARH